MKQLWSTRLKAHLNRQFKYQKLVFNDHFVLALVVLLGAALYGYSQMVRQLTAHWWLAPVTALVLTGLWQVGGLATLIERADATFLLPQTTGINGYLYKARRYSLGLPSLLILLTSFAAWPLLTTPQLVHWGHDAFSGVITLALGLLVFKDVALWLAMLKLWRAPLSRYSGLALAGIVWLSVTLGLYLHPVIVLGVAVGLDAMLRLRLASLIVPSNLDWQLMVAQEERRQTRILRFYNLFTDVPGLHSGVKRRRYLDGFAKLVGKKAGQVYPYLFIRGFLRRSEFIGLYLRLLLIGAVALALVTQWWLAAILAALFVYLVGFQLLPLALAYDEIVFTHLYPVPRSSRVRAFTQLTARLLISLSVLLPLGSLALGRFDVALSAFGGGLAMAIGFAVWYLPLRLRPLTR